MGNGIDISTYLDIGYPEFQSLLREGLPGLKDEWGKIVANIVADNHAGLNSDIDGALTKASKTFFDSYTGYASNDGNQLAASAAITTTNHTASGAGQMLAGLIGKGLDASADLITQKATPIVTHALDHMAGSFLSTLTSVVGTTSTALTATGVGAAVGIGASLLAGAFSSILGGPPPPPFSVGSCGLNTKPDIVCKYCWMYGDPNLGNHGITDGGPNNPYWRRFPNPKLDSVWYKQLQSSQIPKGVYTFNHSWPWSWQWSGNKIKHLDTWYACYTLPGDFGKRHIDQAIYDNGHEGDDQGFEVSIMRQLEFELNASAILGVDILNRKLYKALQQAFFASWKRNREYAFNGLKMQPDWKVLEHVLSVWNGAHAPNKTRLRISPMDNESDQFYGMVTPQTTKQPAIMYSYLSFLLKHYGNSFTNIQLNDDGSFDLNTGDIPWYETVSGQAGAPVQLKGIRLGQKPRSSPSSAKTSKLPIAGALIGGAIGGIAAGPPGAAAGAAIGAGIEKLVTKG